jgi:hypothetical protein
MSYSKPRLAVYPALDSVRSQAKLFGLLDPVTTFLHTQPAYEADE